jgi:hypothetical protein
MRKRKKSKLPTRDWRTVPDSIILARNINGSVFDKAESLHPSESTMLNYCDVDDKRHPEAVLIIDSYHYILAPTVHVEVLP